MCKLITIKCDESEARVRGSDLIGRAVRDARTEGSARRTALLYRRGPPDPPSTADEETLSLRVLKRSSGPPSARRWSHSAKDFVCVVYFPHLNPSSPKNICRT
ncbi:hypothetical protein EVAR_91939_1, partial [Eumeta japonica]